MHICAERKGIYSIMMHYVVFFRIGILVVVHVYSVYIYDYI